MDMVLICRDGLENSVIGNVAVAMEAKRAGEDVGILFTEEALYCLSGKSFEWSPVAFKDRDSRSKILRNATAMGLQATNPKESRTSDLPRLLKQAKEAGIKLMACPIWAQILAVDGKNLPPELALIDKPTMLKELKAAKIVIGGF